MKIRASSLGHIMADSSAASITEKQLITLNGLLEKIKLTEKQAISRDQLIAKRDAPPTLSTGALTYLREKAFEDKYGITDNIENKFLDKGIFMESEAVELCADVLGWSEFQHPCDFVENDLIQGTPDVLGGTDWLADIKCSWDIKTYFKHLFDERITDSLYYWQLQAYLFLTGRQTAYLCYCLMDTPDHLFQKELENKKWRVRDNLDMLDLPADIEGEIFEELHRKHNFDFMDKSKRVKILTTEASKSAQDKIKEKVELARVYYNEIYENL